MVVIEDVRVTCNGIEIGFATNFHFYENRPDKEEIYKPKGITLTHPFTVSWKDKYE